MVLKIKKMNRKKVKDSGKQSAKKGEHVIKQNTQKLCSFNIREKI